MKSKHWMAVVGATLVLAGAACAQPYGMGPGMMGPGPGYGMGGYGMGPGMMGGWGGGYGMGPGMMGGWGGGAYAAVNLSAEQRKKIAEIEQETSKSMWQLMGTMHDQGWHMGGMWGGGPLDEAAARKSYQAMADAQKAMFEKRLEARKRIDAVLTAEQRQQLQRSWSR